MPPSRSFFHSFILLLAAATLVVGNAERRKPYNCTGGSMYFSAHPVDSLLYHNPDLFHDFYVFKCITTVLFTSGDRGNPGNFSRSLESAFEDAYAYMAGVPQNEMSWNETTMELAGYNISMEYIRDVPSVQVVYLRLPDGRMNGSGSETHSWQSLQKLWEKDIRTIRTTDGSAIYTLDSLKHVISTILRQRAPRDIRVLDHKVALPDGSGWDMDHSDHTISARLVEEVFHKQKIQGTFRGYAAGVLQGLPDKLDDTRPDIAIKANAFFKYARNDPYMCKSDDECVGFRNQAVTETNHLCGDVDIAGVATFLEKEYYVY